MASLLPEGSPTYQRSANDLLGGKHSANGTYVWNSIPVYRWYYWELAILEFSAQQLSKQISHTLLDELKRGIPVQCTGILNVPVWPYLHVSPSSSLPSDRASGKQQELDQLQMVAVGGAPFRERCAELPMQQLPPLHSPAVAMTALFDVPVALPESSSP